MSEEQLMKEIIKGQAQKIINLEQYLRIEKEVSDETIKELEQQKAELIEFVEKEKAMAEGYFDYKPKDVILRCDHILKRCK